MPNTYQAPSCQATHVRRAPGLIGSAGIRVSDESEALGLDRAEHSEGGYSLET